MDNGTFRSELSIIGKSYLALGILGISCNLMDLEAILLLKEDSPLKNPFYFFMVNLCIADNYSSFWFHFLISFSRLLVFDLYDKLSKYLSYIFLKKSNISNHLKKLPQVGVEPGPSVCESRVLTARQWRKLYK
uniref:Uncharacterized protein n=1 Tax=Romanomermis culicivorax TaxID=13658 RepID=A0A915KXC0_ROMCU